MVEEIVEDAEVRMARSVESLNGDLSKIRTGRAHTSLLDHIQVSYYGSDVPLSQVARVSVSDSRTIAVSPWEKQMIPAVEKAIAAADLGLNPVTSGDVIRVPLPPLTEERRKEMMRLVRQAGEQAKIAIRNIRRDANQNLKTKIKEDRLPEDMEARTETRIQKLTDSHITMIDAALEEKERDLMEI
ncbi:ribosome recycling factor [Thioalkalivibrio sp. HK1]|uniref:ribosome recycling factor n=1 Tax=Thioalkalivibrio sp. HK1 TaxID=1469245 RepID=UPI00046F3930|nr:ribosome recycling factor [Thioalkalivibrio sp. HK1]